MLELDVTVGDGARLLLEDAPLVVAEGADVVRTTTIRLGAGATAIVRDLVILGRAGEGPGRLESLLRVEGPDGVILHDALRIEPGEDDAYVALPPGTRGRDGAGAARRVRRGARRRAHRARRGRRVARLAGDARSRRRALARGRRQRGGRRGALARVRAMRFATPTAPSAEAIAAAAGSPLEVGPRSARWRTPTSCGSATRSSRS